MFKKSTFICMLLMSCIANAKMYKCTDTNGTVSFKDSPCAANQNTEWQKNDKTAQQLEEEALFRQQQIESQKQRKIEQATEAASWRPFTGDLTTIKRKIIVQLRANSMYNKKGISFDDIKAGTDLDFKPLTWGQQLVNDEGYKIRFTFQASDTDHILKIHDRVIRTDLEGAVTSNKPYIGKRSFEWE